MSLESDIAGMAKQEERLRFKSFSEADAWELGSRMRAAAQERNIPFVIDIRIGNRPLFFTALLGSTPDNPEWVRRKVKTVLVGSRTGSGISGSSAAGRAMSWAFLAGFEGRQPHTSPV